MRVFIKDDLKIGLFIWYIKNIICLNPQLKQQMFNILLNNYTFFKKYLYLIKFKVKKT